MTLVHPYKWEPHTVITEDGWHLTVFRIVSDKNGNRVFEREAHKDKLPVIYQNGVFNDAISSVVAATGPSFALKLADRGYEVWIGNSRGVKYSNYNENDDRWSLKEHWDFNWADMGTYDMPAMMQKVIDISGKPKVTVIGYSMGSAQMFYSLAKF